MTIYTTGEAATALGISQRRVQQACKHYGIGHKHGRTLLLTERDLEYIRSRFGMVGRPGVK